MFWVLTFATLSAFAPLRAQSPALLQFDLGDGQKIQLVRIEAGSFQQGSPANEAGRGADEAPRHVTLTRPFLLGKYPVTRGQFARFIAETHYRTEAESGPSGGFGWDGSRLTQRKEFTWRNPGFSQNDDHPVTLVTYRDAGAFLQWLSRKTGRTFGLPSEAQWEFAARAGATTLPSANDVAWQKGNSANSTHSVGQKPLNAWGLGDMLGNVWEWCEDWYGPYPNDNATDPVQRDSTLSDKPRRVLRGGSWMREAKFCRPAARYRNEAASRNADNGFRIMSFDVSPVLAAPVSTTRTAPVNLRADSLVTSRPVTSPDADPITYATHRSSSPFSFAWLILVPFLGIAFFILRAIVRAISGNLGGSGSATNFRYMPGQPLRVRLVDDGFWVVGDGLSVGTPITCRYEMDGQSQQTDVRYEGGTQGHFVFTGGRPANVSVSVNSGASPFRPMTTGMNTPTTRTIADDDPPYHGNPPAY
ncbi:formylglycine-generating enzyme family protein [Chthoniobacter flavus]|uniref:formylglycine-generating enzyme family protein n=1 Tax=Chthoniobacter flavus TaxID=191863 RepID=UPI0006798D6B|nr:formylglycine-generating enzyme family protein [Chthoniobacter flavus]